MTLKATLGGITFDGATADSDDLIWCAEMIDGWFDSTDVESSRSQLPYGETLTAVHERARSLVLAGSVKSAIGSGRLSDDWFVANRTLKRAMRFQYVNGLLVVIEPDLSLQSYVRRAESRIRVKREGRLAIMSFEVPLLAEDPRRYDSTATTVTTLQLLTTATTVTAPAVNDGDQPTPPVITIDGPATNPKVTHNPTGNYLRWIGTLGGGDTLVIDVAAETVELNAVDDIDALDPASQFFDLQPGSNSMTYERTAGSGTTTAQLDYRDAYS